MLLLIHITRRQKQLAKLKFDEVLSKVHLFMNLSGKIRLNSRKVSNLNINERWFHSLNFFGYRSTQYIDINKR